MKNKTLNYSNIILLLVLFFAFTLSCERDLSEEVEFATFSNSAEIFIDAPIGLGTDFYFPFFGSKATAWTVDESQGYESNASMRFDVPNANDPLGGYAGAIFRVDGAGRDLTGYDALTFWGKASQGVTIGELGFGQDFVDNKYQVNASNVSFGTNWVKYIIPIPDSSKLIEERGMFWYSAGTEQTGGLGYTFWIDDLQFEKLGTVGSPRPEIFNGNDEDSQTFIGATAFPIGHSVTFNLPTGFDQTVFLTPSYFDWTSSNPSVVSIDETGFNTALSPGEATITATLAGVQATGSLTSTVLGNFDSAPTPTQNQADVISIFSDAYINIPVDYYNGYFAPFQTTQGQDDIFINGDNVINYIDLNFVAIGTFLDVGSVNATEMTHIHIDINVQEAIDSGDFINIQLINSVGNNEASGTVPISGTELSAYNWVGFDIPLADFGLASRSELGLIFFISDATISNIFVDNVYYYKE